MGFLDFFTSRKESLTTANINEKINLGEHFYLMTYSTHYAKFLEGVPNRKKTISELFVFRSWTTQFGFRIFSSQSQISEKIIGEIFNQGKFGQVMLKSLEEVDIEVETNMEYEELIDCRWQEYDKTFINNKNSETQIPTRQICSKLQDYCDIIDPFKFMWICTDFLSHLNKIKQEAICIGLLTKN